MTDLSKRVAVITGGASGIGRAVARQLGREGVKAVAIVDFSDSVQTAAAEMNTEAKREFAVPFRGDVTDRAFRASVFAEMKKRFGPVNLCVPAAGITRDGLAVKIDKTTKTAKIYDQDLMEKTVAVNLVAPTYWALETIAAIATDRAERGVGGWKGGEDTTGEVVFIGSISSLGNKGQVGYAATKAGLEGVRGTLAKEAAFHGVRVGLVHPGFTDTPMVGAMDQKIVNEFVLPKTQLGRLIKPEEIADAICFMIKNPAVSGSIWADAGWHPPAV